MQHLKSGIIAVIFGLSAAFATDAASSKTFNTEYGRLSDGSWIQITPLTEQKYHCASSSSVCKATFPQDPNDDESGKVVTQNNGTYMLN